MGKKGVFSSDEARTIRWLTWGQKNIWPLTHTIHENQFQVDYRFNMKDIVIKLLENIFGECHYDLDVEI